MQKSALLPPIVDENYERLPRADQFLIYSTFVLVI